MAMIYSKIHEKWFDLEPIINDMIKETETSTSIEELNMVLRKVNTRMN